MYYVCVSTTKLSSKGQVVIPEEIRERLRLRTGVQFAVMAEEDVVILKTIHAPSMKEFNSLIKCARKQAKAVQFTRESLLKTIKEVRSQ